MKKIRLLLSVLLTLTLIVSTGIIGVFAEAAGETGDYTISEFVCATSDIKVRENVVFGGEVAYYTTDEGNDNPEFIVSASNSSTEFQGATVFSRGKGINPTYTAPWYSNGGDTTPYDGTNGYFMSFKISSGATMYVAVLEGDKTWANGTNAGYTLAPAGMKFAGASGDRLYMKHFEAGETVVVPSYGHRDSYTDQATRYEYNPSAFALIWDDAYVDISSISYNGTRVHGFDKNTSEYNVKLTAPAELTMSAKTGAATSCTYDLSAYNAQSGAGSVIVKAQTIFGTSTEYKINFSVENEPYKVINGYNVFSGAIGYNESVNDQNTVFNVTEGMIVGSPAYSDRATPTVNTLTDDLLGASVIRFHKNAGAFTVWSTGGKYYWSDEYIGQDDKYFTEFEMTSPATVIVAVNPGEWPAAPEGWELYTDYFRVQPASSNYYKHFEAGETVSLPGWGNTTTNYDPGAGYWIVWDDIGSADLKSLSYTAGGETVDVAGFDKAVYEYNVTLPYGTESVSLSAVPVFARNLSAWQEGEDCATVTYSADSADLSSGSASITVSVASRNNAITKNYVVNFKTAGPGNDVYVVSDANISASVNGGAVQNWANSHNYKYAPETQISLSVPETEGSYTFMYWTDINSNNILSYSTDYSFKVGSGKRIAAVYSNSEDGALITFSSNNKVYAASYNSITVEGSPYIMGYSFMGWYKDDGKTKVELDEGGSYSSDEDINIFAGWVRADDVEYTVTVTGANETGGSYKYNEKVSFTAKDTDEGGIAFAYWMSGDNIVSYDKTYSFYVSGNTELTAVYQANAAIAPVVVMSAPVIVDTNKIAFFAERDIPAEYEVIETGILLHTSNNVKLDNCTYKAVAKSTSSNGQYTVRKADVSAGETWYAAAYVMYKDANGDVQIIYSNEVSKSM